MSRRWPPRRKGSYRGPNTDAELSAYNAGARAARKADHSPFLSARSGVVPRWRFTREELVATELMPQAEAAAWFLRGWSEETSRLAEADRPTEEEE